MFNTPALRFQYIDTDDDYVDERAASKAALTSYLNKFVEMWNECAMEQAETAHLRLNPNSASSGSSWEYYQAQILGDILASGQATGPGYACYRANIRAAQKIAAALDKGNVALSAPTQSGKTVTMALAFFARHHHVAQSGKRELIFVVTNRSLQVLKATRADFKQYLQVHSGLRCVREKSKNVFRHYNLKDDDQIKDIVVARMRKGPRAEINKMIDKAIREDLKHITLIIDEADEGASDKNSVIKNWMEIAKDAGIDLKFVLVSATGYAYEGQFLKDEFCRTVVRMKPDAGYAGPYEDIKVPFMSFTQFANACGVMRMAGFNRTKDKKSLPEVITEVVRACVDGIKDATSLGFNGRPLNGGQHMAVRAHEKNKDSSATARKIKPLVAPFGIRVVECYGGKRGDKVVEEVIKEHTQDNPDQRLLLLFTGGARRAERFPPEVTVFVDFTDNASTRVSWEQGFIGRASGYGKVTADRSVVVILSDPNYVQVYDTIYKGKVGDVPRAIATIKASRRQFATEKKAADIFRADDPLMLELEHHLVSIGKPKMITQSSGAIRYRFSKKGSVNLHEVMKASPTLQARIEEFISQHYGFADVKLWVDINTPDSRGFYLGVCSINRNSRLSMGGLSRTRNRPRYDKNGKLLKIEKLVMPSFLFDYDPITDKWELRQAQFPLFEVTDDKEERFGDYLPKGCIYA